MLHIASKDEASVRLHCACSAGMCVVINGGGVPSLEHVQTDQGCIRKITHCTLIVDGEIKLFGRTAEEVPITVVCRRHWKLDQ